MASKIIGRNITAGPCQKCGSRTDFTKWENEKGQHWLSCGAKDGGGNFCYGKPDDVASGAEQGRAAAQASPAPASGPDSGYETVSQPAEESSGGSARSRVLSDIFDRMADAHAQLAALAAEASQALR